MTPLLRPALESMRAEVSRAVRDAGVAHGPRPVLVLLQGRDTSVLRHGGITQNRRNFELYLNCVLMDTFQDDHSRWMYASGKSMDRVIAERIARLELALGIRVVLGRRRL